MKHTKMENWDVLEIPVDVGILKEAAIEFCRKKERIALGQVFGYSSAPRLPLKRLQDRPDESGGVRRNCTQTINLFREKFLFSGPLLLYRKTKISRVKEMQRSEGS